MAQEPTKYVRQNSTKFASISHPLSKVCAEFGMRPHKWTLGGEDGWQADTVTVILTDYKYGYTDNGDSQPYLGAGKQRPFYQEHSEAKAHHEEVTDYIIFEGIVACPEGHGVEGPDGERYEYAKFELMKSKAMALATFNRDRIAAYKDSELDMGEWPVQWSLGLEIVEGKGKFAKPKFLEVCAPDADLHAWAMTLNSKASS